MNIQVGKLIEDDLAKVIRRNHNLYDRTRAAQEVGMSEATIRRVIFQSQPVTENSLVGLKKIIEVAVENIHRKLEEARADSANLHQIISKELVR